MEDRQGPPEDSLALLARRVRAGEGAAEAELVERFRRGLALTLRRRCGDPALAEDLAQDTLLVTLQKIRRDQIDDPARLAGFIHGTARNLLAAHQRKQRRLVPMESDLEGAPRLVDKALGQPKPDQLEGVLRDEEARLVRQLLAEMGVQRDRELLIRFYLSEQDKATLCADLDIDEDHFRRVLFRARERLKELWSQFRRRERLAPRPRQSRALRH